MMHAMFAMGIETGVGAQPFNQFRSYSLSVSNGSLQMYNGWFFLLVLISQAMKFYISIRNLLLKNLACML